jgi:hypothetical protein
MLIARLVQPQPDTSRLVETRKIGIEPSLFAGLARTIRLAVKRWVTLAAILAAVGGVYGGFRYTRYEAKREAKPPEIRTVQVPGVDFAMLQRARIYAAAARLAEAWEAWRVEEVLSQADRRRVSGDITGARDILESAEDAPQGPVTFALAETYDPNMLAVWRSRGVAGDAERAKALYRKALELGVTKANMRLEALNTSAGGARMAEARRVEEVLAQADRRRVSGDITGAREILEAAEGGAQGPVTFALAETYDPNMLAAWGSRGVAGDAERAKALYRKALQLGYPRASMRLEALNALSSEGRTATIATSGLSLDVASQLHAEHASRVRLPIEIRPPDAAQKNSFVRIRGLPATAVLSEGHAVAPGAWAVPLIALPTLSIILPGDVQGQSDVLISLVSVDGTMLAEARTLLVVAPPPAAASSGMRLVVTPPPATASSGTSGFVTILASKKSRMDALKAFYDLQQRYPGVLADKTPDVQEVDLADKGVCRGGRHAGLARGGLQRV